MKYRHAPILVKTYQTKSKHRIYATESFAYCKKTKTFIIILTVAWYITHQNNKFRTLHILRNQNYSSKLASSLPSSTKVMQTCQKLQHKQVQIFTHTNLFSFSYTHLTAPRSLCSR